MAKITKMDENGQRLPTDLGDKPNLRTIPCPKIGNIGKKKYLMSNIREKKILPDELYTAEA